MITLSETKDHLLLAELNEEVQNFHYNIHPNIFKPYNREAVGKYFETVIKNENAVAFIAKENDAILGYVLVYKIEFPENPFQYARSYVLIDQILVLKQHQGKGIGGMFLSAVYDFAQKNSVNQIELNHWTLNDSARNFFNKNKFTYYNEKMWKLIE